MLMLSYNLFVMGKIVISSFQYAFAMRKLVYKLNNPLKRLEEEQAKLLSLSVNFAFIIPNYK